MAELKIGPHQQLLDRLRAGDNEAYRELLEQYSQRMLVTALRYIPTHSPTDAYDIVQQVFLALFQRIHELPHDEEFNLGTYLYRLTINASIDHQRRLHGRKMREVPLEEAGQIPDGDSNPVDRIDAERTVNKVLASLSEQDRLIIQMRLSDHSIDQIAVALGVSQATARMRSFRAITAMRQRIEHARATEIE